MTNSNKNTLILGATGNPERYAYKAAHRLTANNIPIVQVGNKNKKNPYGNINTAEVIDGLKNIHTVTMYLGEQNQDGYKQKIIDLHPERVIFNPGAENPSFEEELVKNGIEPIEACTLVMLSTGQF